MFIIGVKFGMPLPSAPKKTHGPDSETSSPYPSAEEELCVVQNIEPSPTLGGVMIVDTKVKENIRLRDHTLWGTSINKENYKIKSGEPSMTVRRMNCIVHPILDRALTVRYESTCIIVNKN